jgi:hypothetical protein
VDLGDAALIGVANGECLDDQFAGSRGGRTVVVSARRVLAARDAHGLGRRRGNLPTTQPNSMSGYLEYLVVGGIVSFATVYLVRLFATKKQKPGCSSGCACPKHLRK